MYIMSGLANTSPLKHPSRRCADCQQLLTLFHTHFNRDDFTSICSPFFGGGSFEFCIQNLHGYRILANELSRPIYCLWDAIKYNRDQVILRLSEVKMNQETFKNSKQQVLEAYQDSDEIEVAVGLLVLNRCGTGDSLIPDQFESYMAKTNFTENCIRDVSALNLNMFYMYCGEGQSFINSYCTRNTDFLFVDPPSYKSKHANGSIDEWSPSKHLLLCKTMQRITGWMLIYDDCPEIRELYKGYLIIPFEGNYGHEIVIISKKKD